MAHLDPNNPNVGHDEEGNIIEVDFQFPNQFNQVWNDTNQFWQWQNTGDLFSADAFGATWGASPGGNFLSGGSGMQNPVSLGFLMAPPNVQELIMSDVIAQEGDWVQYWEQEPGQDWGWQGGQGQVYEDYYDIFEQGMGTGGFFGWTYNEEEGQWYAPNETYTGTTIQDIYGENLTPWDFTGGHLNIEGLDDWIDTVGGAGHDMAYWNLFQHGYINLVDSGEVDEEGNPIMSLPEWFSPYYDEEAGEWVAPEGFSGTGMFLYDLMQQLDIPDLPAPYTADWWHIMAAINQAGFTDAEGNPLSTVASYWEDLGGGMLGDGLINFWGNFMDDYYEFYASGMGGAMGDFAGLGVGSTQDINPQAGTMLDQMQDLEQAWSDMDSFSEWSSQFADEVDEEGNPIFEDTTPLLEQMYNFFNDHGYIPDAINNLFQNENVEFDGANMTVYDDFGNEIGTIEGAFLQDPVTELPEDYHTWSAAEQEAWHVNNIDLNGDGIGGDMLNPEAIEGTVFEEALSSWQMHIDVMTEDQFQDYVEDQGMHGSYHMWNALQEFTGGASWGGNLEFMQELYGAEGSYGIFNPDGSVNQEWLTENNMGADWHEEHALVTNNSYAQWLFDQGYLDEYDPAEDGPIEEFFQEHWQEFLIDGGEQANNIWMFNHPDYDPNYATSWWSELVGEGPMSAGDFANLYNPETGMEWDWSADDFNWDDLPDNPADWTAAIAEIVWSEVTGWLGDEFSEFWADPEGSFDLWQGNYNVIGALYDLGQAGSQLLIGVLAAGGQLDYGTASIIEGILQGGFHIFENWNTEWENGQSYSDIFGNAVDMFGAGTEALGNFFGMLMPDMDEGSLSWLTNVYDWVNGDPADLPILMDYVNQTGDYSYSSYEDMINDESLYPDWEWEGEGYVPPDLPPDWDDFFDPDIENTIWGEGFVEIGDILPPADDEDFEAGGDDSDGDDDFEQIDDDTVGCDEPEGEEEEEDETTNTGGGNLGAGYPDWQDTDTITYDLLLGAEGGNPGDFDQEGTMGYIMGELLFGDDWHTVIGDQTTYNQQFQDMVAAIDEAIGYLPAMPIEEQNLINSIYGEGGLKDQQIDMQEDQAINNHVMEAWANASKFRNDTYNINKGIANQWTQTGLYSGSDVTQDNAMWSGALNNYSLMSDIESAQLVNELDSYDLNREFNYTQGEQSLLNLQDEYMGDFWETMMNFYETYEDVYDEIT